MKIGVLSIELRDLICDAYSDDEFANCLLEEMPDDSDFDYGGLNAELPLQKKVLEAVKWAVRFHGGAQGLAWLGRIVFKGRPNRTDIEAYVIRVTGNMPPPASPPPPSNGGGSAVASGPLPLPTELVAALGLFSINPSTKEFVKDLRPKMRVRDYRPFDLPGRFHLSHAREERLAAILALEIHPEPVYLRWLAERVTVEFQYAAFIAAQALITCARCAKSSDLAAVRAVILDTLNRLDAMVDVGDVIDRTCDVSMRKREVQRAQSLVDMRTKPVPQSLRPTDVDQLIAAMIAQFDLIKFEAVCVRVQFPLRRFVRPEDPLEHAIVALVVMARENRWEQDLVEAAFLEKPDEPAFIESQKRLQAVGGVT